MDDNSSVATNNVKEARIQRREYSSIGIGDVFVVPMTKSADSGRGTTSIKAANASLEITAVIKREPEDFIVQEIGLQRKIPGLCTDDSNNVLDIATVDMQWPVQTVTTQATQTVIHTRKSSKVSVEDIVSNEAGVTATTVSVVTSKSVETVTREDPSIHVDVAHSRGGVSTARVLRNSIVAFKDCDPSIKQAIEEDPGQYVIKSLQVIQMVEQRPTASAMTLRMLESLQLSATKAIVNRDASGLTDICTKIPVRSDSPKEARGMFHAALKAGFYLLQSETTKSTSCNSLSYITVSADSRFHDTLPYLAFPRDLIALYRFEKRGLTLGESPSSMRGGGRKRVLNSTDLVQLSQNGDCPMLRLKPTISKDDRRNVHRCISEASNDRLSTKTVNDIPLTVASAYSSNLSVGSIEGRAVSETEPKPPQTTTGILVDWSQLAARKARKKMRKLDVVSGVSDPFPHVLFVMQKRKKEHTVAMQALVQAVGCRLSDIGIAGIKDMQAITTQYITVANCSLEKVISARNYFKNNPEVGIIIGEPYRFDCLLKKGDLRGNRFRITLHDVKRVSTAVMDGDESDVTETFVDCTMADLELMVDRLASKGFVNFFGSQRLGAIGPKSLVGVRAFDIGRALLQKRYKEAIDLIMQGRLVTGNDKGEAPAVQKVRQVWNDSNGDADATWNALPKGDDLPRERAVLKGLKRYGKDEYVKALGCLQYSDKMFWINSYQSYVWNHMATRRLKEWGTEVVVGDMYVDSQAANTTSPPAFVSQDDFDSDKVSIYDIVLPIPGSNVLYPSNKMGDMYKQFCTDENVSFDDNADAKGGYRNLLIRPENVTSHTGTANDTSVESFSLGFDLPKGCYATMALREAMYSTVDRSLVE